MRMLLSAKFQIIQICRNDANLHRKNVTGVVDLFHGTLSLLTFPTLLAYAADIQLVSILGIGFAQGLYALDAADGQSGHTVGVSNKSIFLLKP